MKRRGLSTIVGATFFVLVMGSTIGYVTYSMDVIDDLAYQVDVKQDTNLNRQSEEFTITDVRVDGNEFNLTVTNTGTIPINITNMWAKNMTDPLWNQTKYKINQLISPGQSVANIGQGTGLVVLDSESYSLRMVTDRGNSLSTQLLSAAGNLLDMKLYVIPSSPVSTSDVTLLYTVRNNLTEGKIIQSLTPILATPITTGIATANFVSGPTPASYDSLQPGELAFFEWTYNIVGNDGDQVTFNATLSNALPGNNATDGTSIIVPPLSTTSINEVLGFQVGIISMNFTSFEACAPDTKDCTSNSSDWIKAFNLTKNTNHMFRLNVTNNGLFDILVQEDSAIMGLYVKLVGGFEEAAWFIKADSTTTNEDPGVYTDHSKILIAGGNTEILYFGIKSPSSTNIESTPDANSIGAIFVVLFAHEDNNGNGSYDPSTDQPYSQNLPFHGMLLE